MPELPEVETIRRQLEPLLVGRRLGLAWAFPHPKFTPALDVGPATVERVGRRGKYLLIGLDGDRELVVHLGMTGSLRVRPPGDAGDAYVRAWWALGRPGPAVGAGLRGGAAGEVPAAGVGPAGGSAASEVPAVDAGPAAAGEALEYRDVRRFGRLAVAVGGRYAGTLAVQGPDALDPSLDPERFWRSLRASRRAVKTQLLSQRPIAGVGNIYADEALWRAGINPARRRITRAQAAALLDELRAVLSESLRYGGTTLTDYRDTAGREGRNQQRLDVYGQAGLPCPRCGTELRSRVLDARTATWCPICQPA
ncbi:MAG TPA: DNA-formamidopyrimidine glycosylase family protein [Acidimicrobiales bacterium]|nr:DNA-formamidopyrimidine glycosylase family protein [Acidimicrobiales bacterium]